MIFSHFNPSMVQSIPDSLPREKLFDLKGWFSLPDIFRTLYPENPERYKLVFKQIARIRKQGLDPLTECGYLKFRHRVFVRMELFGPWLKKNPLFRLKRIPQGQSFESFLRTNNGFFRLSEVCNVFGNKLPMSYLNFIRQADRNPEGMSSAGVFKFDRTHILDLSIFCAWLRHRFSNTR